MTAPETRILTPDQRLRVFVSSTLQELAEERAAVRRAIESARLVPVMFELGARPHPPRSLYRAYLEQSDVFIGVYWQRYGWVAPGESISGLEDEFRLSDGMPRLCYLKTPAPDLEPRLADLLGQLQDRGDASYRRFTTAEELETLVADDLAVLLTERFLVPALPRHAETVPAPRRTLPADDSPFVGRSRDLAELTRLLTRDDVRLLTLTGPGGIGKTRLALRLAREVETRFADGAQLVALSAVTDPEAVPGAIASALGLRDLTSAEPIDAVTGHLAGHDLLLVLDEFEHLVDAAAVVATLLRAAPRLKVLVTSREPLHVLAEHEYPVPPMALPDPSAAAGALETSDAVRLFALRAASVRHGFAVDSDNAATVAGICRRVDAIPLAIELAAARARLLSLDDLLRRLDRGLDFLVSGARDAPSRHRTLRDTIAWSHRLLDASEQELFANLGVFHGRFTAAAVEAVCPLAGRDVLDVLVSLTEKNLLQSVHDGGEQRFRMLATIHDYAAEQLTATGRRDALTERHAHYYRDLSIEANRGLRGPDSARWARRIGTRGDRDNLQAAIVWYLDQQRLDDLAAMAWALWLPAWTSGNLTEAHRIAAAALGIDAPVSAEGHARLLLVYGMFSLWLGREAEALPAIHQAIEVARAHDDSEVIAYASLTLALVSAVVEGEERARERANESLERLRARDDAWGVGTTLVVLGWLDVVLEQHDEPAVFEEALAATERSGDVGMLAMAEDNLGEHLLHEGDHEGAAVLLASALRRFRDLHSIYTTAYGIDGVARLMFLEGRACTAATLLGATEAMREQIGAPIWATAQARHSRLVERVRADTGDAFAQCWDAGARASYGEAVEAALAALADR